MEPGRATDFKGGHLKLVTRPILSAGLLAFAALQASGQEAAKPPEFEAASIKLFEPRPVPGQRGLMKTGGGPCTSPNPGLLLCQGTSLRGLVAGAYGLPNYRVFGPDWLDSARFEIEAKIPHGATREQVNQMLQKLLADRFHLTAHRETREIQQYALVVDKSGPKFKEFKGPAAPAPAAGADTATPPTEDETRQRLKAMTDAYNKGTPVAGFVRTSSNGVTGQKQVEGFGLKMSVLAGLLSFEMNQTVVDQTDLKGEYEIHLSFVPGEGMQRSTSTVTGDDGVPVPVEPPSGGPTIFSALQSQLGLKLEMKKVPTETIVVDSSDRTATAN